MVCVRAYLWIEFFDILSNFFVYYYYDALYVFWCPPHFDWMHSFLADFAHCIVSLLEDLSVRVIIETAVYTGFNSIFKFHSFFSCKTINNIQPLLLIRKCASAYLQMYKYLKWIPSIYQQSWRTGLMTIDNKISNNFLLMVMVMMMSRGGGINCRVDIEIIKNDSPNMLRKRLCSKPWIIALFCSDS